MKFSLRFPLPVRLINWILACVVLCGFFGEGRAATVPYGWGAIAPIPVAEEVRDLVDVAGSGSFAVGIRTDGRIVGWGAGALGVTSIPHDLRQVPAPGAPVPVKVAAGPLHAACLLDDGTVRIWGTYTGGPLSVPSELQSPPLPGAPKATAIAAGAEHTVVLMDDGSLRAWGLAASIAGATAFASPPMPGLPMPIAIACSGRTTAVLHDDGSVVGFGVTPEHAQIPAPLPGDPKAIAVAGYPTQSLEPLFAFTLSDGRARVQGPRASVAWASGITGAVETVPTGWGLLARRADGTLVSGGSGPEVSSVSGPVVGLGNCGPSPVVRFADGRMLHLGSLWGRLPGNVPVHVQGKNIVDMAVARDTTVALDSSGSLHFWDNSVATALPPGEHATRFRDIATGDISFTGAFETALLGVREDGTVLVWGADYGELISGLPGGLTGMQSIAAGERFAVALRGDGTVTAWGTNSAGYNIASGAALLVNVADVKACAYSALALHDDGTVTAWGANTSGSAVAPPGLSNVAAIAASTYAAFALKDDGSVVAWGNGTGTGEPLAVPAGLDVPPPPGNPKAVGIAAGHSHVVVCFDDGSLQTWGNNPYGNLAVPVGIGPVKAVFAGTYASVALVETSTTVSVADASCLESAGPLVFHVSLSHPADGETTVDYTLAPVTAGYPGDFNPPSLTGTVTIPDGESDALVSVPLVDDFSAESDETLTLTLSNPSANVALGDSVALGTIRNDDSDLPVASVAGMRVAENSGAGEITVRLDRATSVAVTVRFILNSFSAIEDEDWSAPETNGTLTIPAGERTATIPFTILDDLLAEPDEAFNVTIHSTVNASIAVDGSAARVSITDDDSVLPAISAGDVSIGESPGDVSVPITLDRAASGDLIVFFQTRGGTALPGRDYLSRTASVLIPEGETSGSVAIQILDNSVTGNDLQFTVELAAVIGPAALDDASAVVTIRDNDRQSLPPWGGVPVVWGDGTPGLGAPVVPVPAPVLTRIAAGPHHVIGMRQDGAVTGWANASWPGGPPVPVGVTDAVDVAAGWLHSLVLKADGTVVAAGAGMGADFVPPGLGAVTAIAAGRFHSLALTADGRVVAWGSNTHGQCVVPPDLPPVIAIAAGEIHSMALTAAGKVVCWGSNLEDESTVPAGLGPCTVIAAGNLRSMAVDIHGQVHYWGYALAGSAVPPPFNAPAAPGAPRIVQANLAGDHAIGLLDNGSIVSWGNLAAHNQEVPVGLFPRVFQVSGGQFFSVALVETTAPPAVTVSDVEVSEGLSAAFGRVRLETIAATEVTVTLATEARTATAGADYQPVIAPVTIPAGSTEGFFSIVLLEDPLPEADEHFRVRLTSVPTGYRAGPSARVTILDNDTIRKPIAWGAGPHLPMTDAVGGPDAMAGGGDHTLALRADGRVQAWGSNLQGQGNVPMDLRPGGTGTVTAISAGETHTMVLTSDGRVLCWGGNASGQINTPTSLGSVPASGPLTPVAISAGAYHSMALLQNGTVLAWGAEPGFFGGGPFAAYGQAEVPPGLPVIIDIAAGGFHSLALTADHVVRQWGSDGFGEMLVPTELASPPAPGARHAVKLAAGWYHSLALMSDGSVITWGAGAGGPAALPVALATAPPVGSRAIAIAAGSGHSLALLENGTVLAWGDDYEGQATVPPGLAGVTAIATGRAHSIALTADGPVIWGANASGQSSIPPVLPLLRAIGKPGFQAAAIRPSKLPVTWGGNNEGTALPPPGLDNLRRVTTGVSFSLALDTGGQITGWGDDTYGQSTAPGGLDPAREVIAGYSHSLAVLENGTVAGWGSGFNGETTPPDYVYNAIDATAGFGFSVALLDDGHVLAWGDPWSGATNVPVDLDDAVAIASGDYHVVALRDDGTVVAWGNNDNGQCDVPAGLTDVIAIAAGQTHSIALTAAGQLVAWGSNEFGESTVPVLSGTVCDLKAGFRQNLLLVSEPSGGASAHMLRWAEDSGLDPESFDPIEDIGGLSGLLRFAFNLEAFDFSYTSYTAGGEPSGMPGIGFIPSPGGGGVLRFTFVRRGDTEMIYRPEVSATMEPLSWEPVTAGAIVTPIDETWEQVVVEHPVAPGTARLFGRVMVTAP